MEKHVNLSDEEFEFQFRNLSLRPRLFTHEAHLRLAWIHIQKYGVLQAIENIRKQIKEYALKFGATDKYHDTITVAAVRAVHHFMLSSSTSTFSAFIQENPQLKTAFWELLTTHYRPERLKSKEARQSYLEPDLMPFDPITS